MTEAAVQAPAAPDAAALAAAASAAAASAAPAAAAEQKPAEQAKPDAAAQAALEAAAAEKAKAAAAPPFDPKALKLSENFKPNDAIMTKLTTFATERKLDQASAQALVDMGQELMTNSAEGMKQAVKDAQVEWQATAKADKEIGGDLLDENLATAKKAFDTFASPELRKLFGEFDEKNNPKGTGFGNHPEVLRTFYRLGKAMSESRMVVPGSGNANPENKTAAEVLYPNQGKQA